VTYDPPEHGWVKLRLTIADQELEIVASDVPNNPVQELAVAVREIDEGRNASVWWHLEPEWYLMSFSNALEGIRLEIALLASPDDGTSKQSIVAYSGADVLRPFLGFLQDFRSKGYAEPNWPEVDWRPLDQLRCLGL
jgi:hypothetical protein